MKKKLFFKEPHDSITTGIPDTDTYVSESTQTSKKPTEHIAYQCNYDIEDFNDMIESIARAMEFFKVFLTDLVVDAAVGTRILQGTSMFFLSIVQPSKNEPNLFFFK